MTRITTVDLGDLPLLPGLVDSHVHVNEPGRTEWEGFASATRAALAGGVTTIVDMPLNSLPVTTTVDALRAKAAAAAGQCAVDVAFWGGAVPGNVARLGALLDAGVVGFKCFLIDSGIAEFPPLVADELRAAMKSLAESGAPMIVHAEDPAEVTPPAGSSYDAFVASRPTVAERRAIETVISAAAATGARAHIVHLAAGDCAALIGAAQAAGVSLTAETCPHYLFFAAEEVPAGAHRVQVLPAGPVRGQPGGAVAGARRRRDRRRRVRPLAVHAGAEGAAGRGLPHRVGRDRLAPARAVGGLVGGAAARVLAGRRRAVDVGFPASLAGLPNKGRIAVGCDADFVAFDPDATFVVRGAELLHKHPVTPYEGRTLYRPGHADLAGRRRGHAVRPAARAAAGAGRRAA